MEARNGTKTLIRLAPELGAPRETVGRHMRSDELGIGENNTGKTTVMDALRLLLLPGRDLDALRINEDDFCYHSPDKPIEISCLFCELAWPT